MRARLHPGNILKLLLLWAAFGGALFFTGTDSLWVGPSLISLIALGALLLAPGVKAGWKPPRTATALFAALFWLSLVLTLPWSTAIFTSHLFVVILSTLPFLFFILILSQDPQGETRRAALGMLTALAAVAAGAVIQFMFMKTPENERIHLPLLDPNNLASAMNMGFLPAAALFLTGREGRKPVFAALTALFWAALLATESRSGLLCAGAGLAVLLALAGRPLAARWRALAVLAAIMALTPALMQGWAALHYPSAADGLQIVSLSPGSNSVTDRLHLWRSALKMALSRPWTGFGAGSFYYNYPRWRQPGDLSDGFFVHMDPLQFWLECGLAAAVFFYAVLAAVLVRTIRAAGRCAPDSAARAGLAASFPALLAVALQAHVNFTLYLPALIIPASCLLARWHAAADEALAGEEEGKKVKAAPAFALFVLLALFSGIWLARVTAGIHFIGLATACEARGNDVCMEKNSELASRYAPADYRTAVQYEARWRILRLMQHGEHLAPSEVKSLVTDGLAAIRRAEGLNPAFACMRTDEARLDILGKKFGAVEDGDGAAETVLRDIVKNDPLCLEARQELVFVYKGEGRYRDALDVLLDGMNWPRPKGQPDVDYLATTANLYHLLGDDDAYKKLIDEAGRRAVAYGLVTAGPQTGP